MTNDTNQILILLILINIALCSYYFLLYKDKQSKKYEDHLINYLDEKFSKNKDSKELAVDRDSLINICNPFHDKFFDNNKFLGWRLFYLKNQSNKLVHPDNNFKGTIVQNYLNNMENVNNEVTPIKYQIR